MRGEAMIPVLFEGCFGWLHPAAGRRGVVLCSPWEGEEPAMHRAWRDLARQLAAAGLPALRYDHPGCGDSAGGEEDPARLRAWIDGVHAATRFLRETGVAEVALVGLRLGALLAGLAAREMGGVDRLVLLAPCVSGRGFVRELRALARLAGVPPDPGDGGPDGGLDAAGFRLSAETVAALNAADLTGLSASPARRVLLMNPPDGRTGALAARLRALGAEVEEEAFSDLATLMNSVQRASGAVAGFDRVTGWLARDAPRAGPVRIPASAARLDLPGASEVPVRFGDGLFGILCEPAAAPAADNADAARRRPAVLLLNSGATHHVGSGRMSVRLARRLAARGMASLRIDTGGIGDSASRSGRGDNLVYCRDGVDDARAALDWLAGRGYRRFVAVGLCAGAALALHTTLADGRVVGLAMVNPGRFVLGPGATSETVIAEAVGESGRYLRRLGEPAAWRAVLRGDGKAVRALRALGERAAVRLMARLAGKAAGAGDAVQWFHRLGERGVRTLLVYSAGDPTLGELEARFGPGGGLLRPVANLRMEWLDGADHSLLLRPARERFIGLLEAHLEGIEAEFPYPARKRAAPRAAGEGAISRQEY